MQLTSNATHILYSRIQSLTQQCFTNQSTNVSILQIIFYKSKISPFVNTRRKSNRNFSRLKHQSHDSILRKMCKLFCVIVRVLQIFSANNVYVPAATSKSKGVGLRQETLSLKGCVVSIIMLVLQAFTYVFNCESNHQLRRQLI